MEKKLAARIYGTEQNGNFLIFITVTHESRTENALYHPTLV